MKTVTRTVDFAVKGKRKSERGAEEPKGRVPRISKLMALAIRYDQMLDEGVVQSQTELAELLHVSQPRMTQIMNLLHLAPEIQEEILLLNEQNQTDCYEHGIRIVTQEPLWINQQGLWRSQSHDQVSFENDSAKVSACASTSSVAASC
ncbi:MAG: hypothetical protein KDA29_14755 [Phycisphaerales bacterium]|nr:hypothetical protein [Phycisphaerales bacterium]